MFLRSPIVASTQKREAKIRLASHSAKHASWHNSRTSSDNKNVKLEQSQNNTLWTIGAILIMTEDLFATH
eukprot:5931405-Amphidinium_carterae.1